MTEQELRNLIREGIKLVGEENARSLDAKADKKLKQIILGHLKGGRTIAQAAKMAGISTATYYKWAKGDSGFATKADKMANENIVTEKYQWEKVGDREDKKFFMQTVQWAKDIYSNIAPVKYDMGDFEKDLDKIIKKVIVPEMDDYAKVPRAFGKQTREERKYTNKVWEDWSVTWKKTFPHTKTYSGWKGQLNNFGDRMRSMFKVLMMAHGGDTSSMGYKVMKNWKKNESLTKNLILDAYESLTEAKSYNLDLVKTHEYEKEIGKAVRKLDGIDTYDKMMASGGRTAVQDLSSRIRITQYGNPLTGTGTDNTDALKKILKKADSNLDVNTIKSNFSAIATRRSKHDQERDIWYYDIDKKVDYHKAKKMGIIAKPPVTKMSHDVVIDLMDMMAGYTSDANPMADIEWNSLASFMNAASDYITGSDFKRFEKDVENKYPLLEGRKVITESTIGVKTERSFKPNDLTKALDKAKIKYKFNRLSMTLSVIDLDKKYFDDAKKVVDDLGLSIMMAKESKVNEDYSQRARNFRVALRRRLETMKKGEKISYGKLFYIAKGNGNFKDNRGRTVPYQDMVQTFKFAVEDDIMQHRGVEGDDMVDAYLTFESKVNEYAPAEKELKKLGVEYEKNGKSFKKIHKPIDKSDKFYKSFDDIISRYNLSNAVVLTESTPGDLGIEAAKLDDYIRGLETKTKYKKRDKIVYQLTHKGGVGKYANAMSKSKNYETGVIRKATKGIGDTYKYELTNGLELYGSEVVGLSENKNTEMTKRKIMRLDDFMSITESKGQIVNEVTDHDFNYKSYTSQLKNQAGVKKAMKSAGFGNLDTKGAEKQLKKMADTGLTTMFAHMAYYYIVGKDKKTYFIHETQYWVSDFYDKWTKGEDVNVSRIGVQLVENYAPQKWMGQGSTGDKTPIGVALVPKKDFLAGLKKVEQLENSNRI